MEKDYFIEEDGVRFAGRHLILDLYECDPELLKSEEHIIKTLIDAAGLAGATVLSNKFHKFEPNGGVSGVVVLAESHITIHTWPEKKFAAIDFFVCGDCDPRKATQFLVDAYKSGDSIVSMMRRGEQMLDYQINKARVSYNYPPLQID